MQWWVRVLAVAAVCVGTPGCLQPGSSMCGDGLVCAPGKVCVAALSQCADPAQLTACNGVSDGARCATVDIPIGTCTSKVCVSSGCGNGLVETGEACDDGNIVSGDGCSANCASTEVCGNLITDVAEQCDCGTPTSIRPGCPGPNSDTSGPCSTSCKLRCGDGVVSPDEGCDPAVAATVSCAGAVFDRGLTTCSASCQPVISIDTCKYIGWRTRITQPASPMPHIVDIASTGSGRGFFIAGNVVNFGVDYKPAGTPYTAPAFLTAVWAADETTAIAVGLAGTIVHGNGTTWAVKPSGTTADLRDVWGRGGSDVYAVGQDTVLHFDGSTWSPLLPPAGNYRAITGDDTSHIYVAGDGGIVSVWDGVAWQTSTPTTADLSSIWWAGGRVVAVGAAGTILQNDGSGWIPGRSTTSANLRGVWGSAANVFYAAGERGTVLAYDDHVWRTLALGRGVTGPPSQTFPLVGGFSDDFVGAIGTEDILSFEGAAWVPTAVPTAQTILGLWGSAPDDVFAVGRYGTILHHDGLVWTPQASPTTVDLHAVGGTAPDDVWAVGDDLTLLHYDGLAWSLVRSGPASGFSGDFLSVYAASPTDLEIASTVGIYRYAVTTATLTRPWAIAKTAIWGTSPTDVWAAGAKTTHFDGAAWTDDAAVTGAVSALAGSGPSDVYAIGAMSFHYNGTAWSPVPLADTGLVAASAVPGRVFAAGAHGALLHSDGTAIEPFISRTTSNLNAVAIVGDLVVTAGDDGTLEVMLFRQ